MLVRSRAFAGRLPKQAGNTKLWLLEMGDDSVMTDKVGYPKGVWGNNLENLGRKKNSSPPLTTKHLT